MQSVTYGRYDDKPAVNSQAGHIIVTHDTRLTCCRGIRATRCIIPIALYTKLDVECH